MRNALINLELAARTLHHLQFISAQAGCFYEASGSARTSAFSNRQGAACNLVMPQPQFRLEFRSTDLCLTGRFVSR
jgi:hypothetical protein